MCVATQLHIVPFPPPAFVSSSLPLQLASVAPFAFVHPISSVVLPLASRTEVVLSSLSLAVDILSQLSPFPFLLSVPWLIAVSQQSLTLSHLLLVWLVPSQ